MTVDEASLQTAGGRRMQSFIPTMNLEVTGFRNDYRSDGLGAPLAAGLAPAPRPPSGLILPPHLRVPTTAVLRMDDPRRQLMGGELTAQLAVYSIYDTGSIRIGGYDVPLEYDQTAVRALFVSESRIWDTELSGLLNNRFDDPAATDHLYALEPHRQGRIPVVLVHGTASSPFRWSDMINDLLEDKEIRAISSSGCSATIPAIPIPLSANILRTTLARAVQSLGGVAADPALGRMVVIGHSQGGLLTKLIAIDSGSRIWDAVSSKPLDTLALKPETKALLRESLFVQPLPFVKTVVFIATPHGGSFHATLTVAGLFQKLVTLPLTVVGVTADLLANAGGALRMGQDRLRLNSIAGMSPGNPAMEAVRATPIGPGIHAYSIIPTLQDGPLDQRDDGVVEYRSAHLDGVELEVVIEHSGHSTQGNPLTVREVRRILMQELARPGRGDAGPG